MNKKKDDGRKKFRLRPWIIAALAVLLVVAVYSGTSAWLTGSVISFTRFAKIEDFEFSVTATLVDPTNGTVSTPAIDEFTGAYLLSTQPGDSNYIGNLRVSIRQDGAGVAFVRVKLTHDFRSTSVTGSSVDTVTHFPGNVGLPYVVNNSFADKTGEDAYYYYRGAFPADSEVNFINSGFSSSDFDYSADVLTSGTNTRLLVNISVDAVQFNRVTQIWGTTRRPWAS